MQPFFEKFSSNEKGLQYKLVVIEALIFVLPALTVAYILWKSNVVIEFSHLIIIVLILMLVLSSMVLIRQIFDKVIRMAASIKMAQNGDGRSVKIEADTAELHEIALSFNDLMDRFETTSEELKRRTFELLTIKELIESVSRSLDIEKMIELLLEKAMGISKAQIGSVLFVESEKKRFRIAAYKGREKGPDKNAYINFSASVARQVVTEKQPLIVEDIESDPRIDKPYDPSYETRSFLSMPIFLKHNLVAVLNLADKQNQNVFDSDDEHILSIMIGEIGFALENAMLHSNIKEHLNLIQKRTMELTRANDQLKREINDRKRIEAELRRHEKLQGVLEMAGAVCHELNQPMQAISGYAEIMMMDLADGHPHYGKIGQIRQQIERMGNITKKLMRITDYETMDYLNSRIIDIDRAAQSAL